MPQLDGIVRVVTTRSGSGTLRTSHRYEGPDPTGTTTETHAFTEADGSLSTGILVNGTAWKRPEDSIGVAYMRSTLSADRKAFLAAGGTSFFIGDGALNYRPETILETFYSVAIRKGVWITADYQRIQNPAYNADRGPVNVIAFRFHTEF